MSLISGDTLSSSISMGTDIPAEGLVIASGKSAILHIWVGADLFSAGTQVSIEIQRQNQFELKKYLVLS